jgi:hypothetical protein
VTTSVAPVKNGFPVDARGAAECYLDVGLCPIPLPPKSKIPVLEGWPNIRVTAENVGTYFTDDSANVGVLNGSPSADHVDVDLDCPEARAVAPYMLPQTNWIFGRRSSPQSHYIFRAEGSDSAALKYEDVDGSVMVELRGTGGQTMFPPSIHPTGERLGWHVFADAGFAILEDLQRAVAEVAAAALLARHWPAKGSRDAAALALSGALARAEWLEEKVSRFVEAVAVAAGDEEARSRAGKAKPTAARMEDGKETTGWPTLAKLLGEGNAVVERVREWLGLGDKAPAELPLPNDAPWPEPLAEQAFHGLAGEIVRVIEPDSEVDPAALLFQILVGVGNIVGREVFFQVEADRHHCNEFAVLVGKTAKARKGASWGHVEYLLNQVEETWTTDRVQSGLSSGEGLIWAVRDPIVSREKTKEDGKIKFVDVEKDGGVADKRLQIVEPEFANVLKQVERTGNTLSVILRIAWDGGRYLRSMTKNSPAKATGAHVSLVGHITVEELRRLLSATETANGFANRFLWIGVQRSKLLPEGGNVDRGQLDSLALRVAQNLATARGRGRIYRDDDARALWGEVYAELSEGRAGMAGALMARAEAHVMRLSTIYAILDGAEYVGVPHLLAALALWKYVEQTIAHVFGDSLGDPVADELLRLLRGCPSGMTRTQIRDYFQRNASSERVGRALSMLLHHKLVTRQEVKTGGRPSERWVAGGKPI